MEPRITIEDLRVFNIFEQLCTFKLVVQQVADDYGISYETLIKEVSMPEHLDVNKIISSKDVLIRLLTVGYFLKVELDKYPTEQIEKVTRFREQLSGFTKAQ